jgi:hypothetical protein
VSTIIPFATLIRQQQVSYLKHKAREYQEREAYLRELRKLLFQIEARMRHAEFQQLDLFQAMGAHFQIPLGFPDLGDRVGLQELFASQPFLTAVQDFFGGRLTAEECYEKILALSGQTSPAQA